MVVKVINIHMLSNYVTMNGEEYELIFYNGFRFSFSD